MARQKPRAAALPIVAEIAAEMDRQGLTRYALAKRAGVTPAVLGRVLSGERPDPQASTLIKLAGALGKRVALVDDGKGK